MCGYIALITHGHGPRPTNCSYSPPLIELHKSPKPTNSSYLSPLLWFIDLMYGRKRRFSGKAGHFASKRRKAGARRSKTGVLPPDGGKSQFQNPLSFYPSGGGRGNRTTMVRYKSAGSWVPDRLEIPLKWTAQATFTIATGVGSQVSIHANSLADPGGASFATAPYGYDQLVTLYSRYRIVGASINTQWTYDQNSASTASLNSTFRAIIWPSRTTTSFVSDDQGASQHPYAKTQQATFPQSSAGRYGGGMILNNYISTAKIFGDYGKAVLLDDTYASLIAASPSRQWYWNILAVAQNAGASLSASFACQITLIQYVHLFDRQSLSST